MNITFLILFGLSVLAANAMIAGIEGFAKSVKDEFAKREDKKMTQKTVTLDEFLNERGDFVKQVVYKIDGDFNGDIKGENVTIILMGDGDINGDINAKNGEVFVNKGNINGNVKADKILCPNEPRKETCEMCKYYVYHDGKHYWCTHGGMCHLCIKDGTVCKYYEGRK